MRHDKGVLLKGTAAVLAIAVLMVFSAGDLWSKDRVRGAELIFQGKDGTFLRGELLAVEGRILVLLDASSGKETRISIDDVDAFRALKKAGVLPAMLKGFLIGGVPIAGLGLIRRGNAGSALMGGAVLGGVLAVYKGFRAAAKGQDETAVLRGASVPKTDFALKRLKDMALFPKSLPADIGSVIRSRGTRTPTAPGETYRDLTAVRFPRFHLSFEPFGILSEGEGPYIGLFRTMEFADTEPGGSFLFISWGPVSFPVEHGRGGIRLRGGRAEYSVSRSFSVGFAYASMGSGTTDGYRQIPVTFRGEPYYSEADLTEKRSGDGYFLTASWMPIPDTFFRGTSFKLGVEMGVCVSRHHFGTSEHIGAEYVWVLSGISPETLAEGEIDGRSFSRTVPAAGVFGEVDFYSGRNMSLGFRAGYRYARIRFRAFPLAGTYLMLEEDPSGEISVLHLPLPVTFPAHSADLGGPFAGLSLGFHF